MPEAAYKGVLGYIHETQAELINTSLPLRVGVFDHVKLYDLIPVCFQNGRPCIATSTSCLFEFSPKVVIEAS